MAQSDAVLLRRWFRQGDANAFTELVLRHSGMVYATCRRIMGNPADAEEIAQDSFTRSTRKI